MRASEFISEEQKLDEILPFLAGAARGVAAAAGGAAKVAGKVGGAVARNVVGATANSVGRMAANKLGSDNTAAGQQTPNGVIGTQSQPNVKSSQIPPKPSTQSTTTASAAQDNPAAMLTKITPGANLQLPTGTGKVGNFKISKIMGKDVEIENPDKNKNPNEPDKLVYNKDDLMKSMGVK